MPFVNVESPPLFSQSARSSCDAEHEMENSGASCRKHAACSARLEALVPNSHFPQIKEADGHSRGSVVELSSTDINHRGPQL